MYRDRDRDGGYRGAGIGRYGDTEVEVHTGIRKYKRRRDTEVLEFLCGSVPLCFPGLRQRFR